MKKKKKSKIAETSSNKERIGVTLSPETIRCADINLKNCNCRSRSDLIEEAINFYIKYKLATFSSSYVAREVAVVIEGNLDDMEKRMRKHDFRVAVELYKLSFICARLCDMTKEELEYLEAKAIHDVKKINGVANFETAVAEYQKNDTWEG